MSYRLHHLLAVMLAIATLCPGDASAAQVTGQQLLSLCTANAAGGGNEIEAAECLGFIVGVADTFDCIEPDHGFNWNSKVDVTQPRLVGVVIQWLQDHPAAKQYEGHRVVGAALSAAFPCGAKTAGN
ncbi:MAG: Rap1a/Tai family immunity protein [Alphaproteobacteria bacterium]|nr:Rap1a/Tai family immunity protein [Alphaproteobacteria bacterium]